MSFWCDFREYVHHVSICIENKCRALGAHILLAIHVFLDPAAITHNRIASDVGKQWEIQRVFLNEFLMAFCIVLADAKHEDLFLFECSIIIAKALRLESAARGIILRIEVDHNRRTAHIAQIDRVPVAIW